MSVAEQPEHGVAEGEALAMVRGGFARYLWVMCRWKEILSTWTHGLAVKWAKVMLEA